MNIIPFKINEKQHIIYKLSKYSKYFFLVFQKIFCHFWIFKTKNPIILSKITDNDTHRKGPKQIRIPIFRILSIAYYFIDFIEDFEVEKSNIELLHDKKKIKNLLMNAQL